MAQNISHYVTDYIFDLGVPARFASPSGFPLIVRGRKAVGQHSRAQ